MGRESDAYGTFGGEGSYGLWMVIKYKKLNVLAKEKGKGIAKNQFGKKKNNFHILEDHSEKEVKDMVVGKTFIVSQN